MEQAEKSSRQEDDRIQEEESTDLHDKQAADVKLVKYQKETRWNDGTFVGSGTGFGGQVQVQVVIKKGKIMKIAVLSHEKETPAYFTKAQVLVGKILAAQSPNVDVVSGATYSSRAVMEAYERAYEKAVVKNRKTKSRTKSTKKPIETKTPKTMLADQKTPSAASPEQGQIKDGTYHVSAACEPDEKRQFSSYTLYADVIFKDKKCTAIENFTSSAETNRAYYLKAANGTKKLTGIVGQILSTQTADGIYAVTGATCSSKTIRSLYIAALTQATGVEKTDTGTVAAVTPAAETAVAATEKPGISQVTEKPETGQSTEEPAADQSTKEPGTSQAPEVSASPAVTQEPAGLKDGVYPVSVVVYPDENEDFDEYTLSADGVVKDGAFTGFENISVDDSTNLWYCNLALKGSGDQDGILVQLLQKQNAAVIDSVTGATCSSEAWKNLFQEVYKKAGGMS